LLPDSGDSLKRNRDAADSTPALIQKTATVTVQIVEDDFPTSARSTSS